VADRLIDVFRRAVMADGARFKSLCDAIREDIERRFAGSLRSGVQSGSLARFVHPIFPLVPRSPSEAEQALRFMALSDRMSSGPRQPTLEPVEVRPGRLVEMGPSAAAAAPPAQPRGPVVYCQSQYDPDD